MTYTQKYCLVQFIQTIPVDYEFTRTEWPLHCTLAGVFAWDWNSNTKQDLAMLLANSKPFGSYTTGKELFGHDQSVTVMLVRPTKELHALHERIITLIEQHGGAFNQPAYIRNQYRPHVTMIGNEPTVNTPVQFTKLSLIDMFPNGDYTARKVIAEFTLSGTG